MKTVILAAGLGTRLKPITNNSPKILLPLFDIPFLDYFYSILDGISDEIILVIGDYKNRSTQQKIVDYVASIKPPIKTQFILQKEQVGTAHALQQCSDILKNEESFLILNGDDLYDKEDIKLVCEHKYAIMSKIVENPTQWGILKQNTDGFLDTIIEKPSEFVGNTANIGMYKVGKNIFKLFKDIEYSSRNELEITDSISLFAKKHNVHVLHSKNYWYPVGRGEQYFKVHEQLLKHHSSNIIIKDNQTQINKNLFLGLNSSIGEDVRMHGTNIIGANSKIKKSSLENCLILENVNIENSTLRNCIIQANLKISNTENTSLDFEILG